VGRAAVLDTLDENIQVIELFFVVQLLEGVKFLVICLAFPIYLNLASLA
jgi:hypothetical protein